MESTNITAASLYEAIEQGFKISEKGQYISHIADVFFDFIYQDKQIATSNVHERLVSMFGKHDDDQKALDVVFGYLMATKKLYINFMYLQTEATNETLDKMCIARDLSRAIQRVFGTPPPPSLQNHWSKLYANYSLRFSLSKISAKVHELSVNQTLLKIKRLRRISTVSFALSVLFFIGAVVVTLHQKEIKTIACKITSTTNSR